MSELDKVESMTNRIEQLYTEIENEMVKYDDFDFPEGSLITKLNEERKSLTIERALLWRKLKSNGEMLYTNQEIIMDKLNESFPNVKSGERVELFGESYIKRFQPVELNKTGKKVKKYWPYWLRLNERRKIDESWKTNIHQMWPDMFLIKADRNKASKY
ncbi:hypothetical protein GCM10009128_16480 [Psychrosphaera haliotis]|uniref:hypothetical protein n=1 Tax=Psychrosphaera haliotis TaxID=555083 RepID=UPI0031DC7A86